MNRRGFLKFLPSLAALPFIGRFMPKVHDWSMNGVAVRNGHRRYWAGTNVPRSNPWQELSESEKRMVMHSQAQQYAYFYVDKNGKVTAPSPFHPGTIDDVYGYKETT